MSAREERADLTQAFREEKDRDTRQRDDDVADITLAIQPQLTAVRDAFSAMRDAKTKAHKKAYSELSNRIVAEAKTPEPEESIVARQALQMQIDMAKTEEGRLTLKRFGVDPESLVDVYDVYTEVKD